MNIHNEILHFFSIASKINADKSSYIGWMWHICLYLDFTGISIFHEYFEEKSGGASLYWFQSSVVPLFLGADLFSNTDIRTENHPRHHAKFAKKGLATKINFSSGKMRVVPKDILLTYLTSVNNHWHLTIFLLQNLDSMGWRYLLSVTASGSTAFKDFFE